jgi:hypothetical protein
MLLLFMVLVLCAFMILLQHTVVALVDFALTQELNAQHKRWVSRDARHSTFV